MARKKTPEPSQISRLFTTSEDLVDRYRKRFEEARTTLVNARTYGTAVHAEAASRALVEAAELYADKLRTHAHLVVDYATEFAAERSS